MPITTLTCLLVAISAGCGTSHRQLPAQKAASPRVHVAHRPAHVAVILMENEEYGNIIGSPSTPFINGLARRYATATSAYAITHPSLPNYLALTGGSTFGITSDCTDCSVSGSGLAGQLAARRVSWKAYMEDMPGPCFTGSSAGDYAKRHDPFMYFRGIAGNPVQCRRVVPMTALASDERRRSLPRFVWITPNLCHDMHDCSTSTGDRFLAGFVPPLLKALGRKSLLILTWDEGSTSDGCCKLASGGHIATILAGPLARRHAYLRTPVDHYSVLQLIDDVFGLRRLGAARCPCTASLGPLLRH
jgi:phosphatidylinositol-3-phosphatase